MIVDVIRDQWRLVISLWAPVILIFIPVFWDGHTGKEPYAAYVILLMAIYWMTECIPLAITSFLPVLLFPLFGIIGSDRISNVYLQDSIMFLLGGVVIALAVEYSNLHTRIAVKVILLVGAKIPRLLLGIMLTTMFLSMWMNNTSTTAMMVPIVLAIIEQLKSKMLAQASSTPMTSIEPSELVPEETEMFDVGRRNSSERDEDAEEMERRAMKDEIERSVRNLKNMFLIATAYSSNLGGTGVITGSATNIIALDLVRKDADHDLCPADCKEFLRIGFLDWMLFNVPPMLLNTILCWGYLQIHFLGIPPAWKFWQGKQEKELQKTVARMEATVAKSVRGALRRKYEELGDISFHEVCVLVIFIITVLLWIFKDPQFMPGWDALPIFKQKAGGKSFIKESTPTLLMCTFLFFIPRKREYFENFANGGLDKGLNDTLLTWKFVNDKFPWGVFILLGGGSAMAVASRESGLNKWVEEVLENSETLKAFPAPILFILMLSLLTLLTSIASNIACAAIITPVLLGLSYVKDLHPLYLVLSAATTCSYAFMLPVSTPPNAIVYSASSEMKLPDMIKAGFVTNIFCLVTLFVTTHTIGDWIYGFQGYGTECSNMTLLVN